MNPHDPLVSGKIEHIHQKSIEILYLWLVKFMPIGFMYGIFTYIWVIFRANVGKYSIHGSYGMFL